MDSPNKLNFQLNLQLFNLWVCILKRDSMVLTLYLSVLNWGETRVAVLTKGASPHPPPPTPYKKKHQLRTPKLEKIKIQIKHY